MVYWEKGTKMQEFSQTIYFLPPLFISPQESHQVASNQHPSPPTFFSHRFFFFLSQYHHQYQYQYEYQHQYHYRLVKRNECHDLPAFCLLFCFPSFLFGLSCFAAHSFVFVKDERWVCVVLKWNRIRIRNKEEVVVFEFGNGYMQ